MRLSGPNVTLHVSDRESDHVRTEDPTVTVGGARVGGRHHGGCKLLGAARTQETFNHSYNVLCSPYGTRY